MINKEIWMPIKGYETFYDVSSFGRVKSLDRVVVQKNGKLYSVKERILSPNTVGTGYLAVQLCIKGDKKKILIHIMVAIAFHENPDNKPEVNHKDGNKKNNHYSNLEWSTELENSAHAKEHGLSPFGDRIKTALFSNATVLEIFNSTLSYSELMNKYKVSRPFICDIKTGKKWSRITGKQYKRYLLTDDDVVNIYNSNLEYPLLAKKYNIKDITVKNIKRGITWPDLTGHYRINEPISQF